MRFLPAHRLAALFLCGPLAFAAFAQGTDAPQTGLPTVKLSAGIHVIRAEVAADVATRATGLMHRTSMGANDGMLFVFERRDRHCFWMRNTLIPLSIAFLDDDGRIVNVADMAPRSEESHCPTQPVRYALEMNRGWFAAKGLAAGAKVSGLPR